MDWALSRGHGHGKCGDAEGVQARSHEDPLSHKGHVNITAISDDSLLSSHSPAPGSFQTTSSGKHA